jgi:hypothetical protein
VTEREIQVLKDNMQRLEKVVEDQKDVIDMNMEANASEIRALKADTSQQFLNMADVFRESLASAITTHDAAMNAQFSEIKAMIAAGPAISSPRPRSTNKLEQMQQRMIMAFDYLVFAKLTFRDVFSFCDVSHLQGFFMHLPRDCAFCRSHQAICPTC